MSRRGRGRGYQEQEYYPPDDYQGGRGWRGRGSGPNGWQGAPAGHSRGGWGYNDRRGDDGYRGGGGSGYRDGPRGGGSAPRSGGYYDDRGGGGGSGYHEGGGRGGGRSGGYYDDGYRDGGGGPRGRGRGRYSWGRGGGQRSRPPRPRDLLPDDVELVAELRHHTKPVTCICVDTANQQLYTGSQDGQVCAWSCTSGQLVTAADCGMPVDSLLVECGFLFVGVSEGHSSAIKVWNLGAGGAQHTLTGHTGQVLALAVSPANGYLFSGGLDAAIRVWELNSASGQFQCTATLCRDSGGGHRAAVHTLLVAGQFFFSGDRNGELKVWSLAEGACVQTIERAHDGPIMKMLLWGENYLLTGSMDGSIRCWSPGSGTPGAILNPEPEFTYVPDQDAPQQGRKHPVLSMCATTDAAQASVLMVSFVADRSVRLLELPSFEGRGCLPKVFESRAMLTMPEAQTMLAGDRDGSVKIFRWKAPPMA